MLVAVVTLPFSIGSVTYKAGDQITDPVTVALIRATPAYVRNASIAVVGSADGIVPAPSSTASLGYIPAPATLDEARVGLNALDYMTPVATAAAIAAQALPASLLGGPQGVAQLDAAGRQVPGQDRIRAWQVIRAARPIIAATGGSWSDLLARQAGGPDATDGSFEAVQGGTPAPLGGVLSTMILTYLVTALGQSSTQAQAALASIYASAPLVIP